MYARDVLIAAVVLAGFAVLVSVYLILVYDATALIGLT